VFVIVLENHSYGDIVGNPDAPFLNRLARTAGVATAYSAVTHPSQPNYVALVSGSTHGVTSDDYVLLHAPSLFDQVRWRSYVQSLDGPLYARKHDPAAIFGKRSEDWSRFLHEPVAPFTWISPDLCHDMHGAPGCDDGPRLVRAGDAFVRGAVTRIERSRAAWTPGSLIVVTFDEGSGDNHVLTVVIRQGGGHRVWRRPTGHYSLLRLLEVHFGVQCLGHACTAPPLGL
jgi:phosphatidylinositol-3-phosphatase